MEASVEAARKGGFLRFLSLLGAIECYKLMQGWGGKKNRYAEPLFATVQLIDVTHDGKRLIKCTLRDDYKNKENGCRQERAKWVTKDHEEDEATKD